MSENNLLTIFMPIKDRPEFTKRCLNYLSICNCKFPIFIADGSKDDVMKNYIKKIKPTYSLQISYKKYPPDSNFIKFINKLSDSIKRIKTPYVVWASDDDFYDLDELQKGIDFLLRNKEYRSYCGEVINFCIDDQMQVGSKKVYGGLKFKGYQYASKRLIDENTVLQRISRYEDLKSVECIHYSATLEKIFQIAKDVQADSYFTLGPIFQYVTLIEGKSFFNNKVFLLRQDDTPFSAGKEMIDENISILHKLGNKDYAIAMLDVFDRLANIFASNSKIDGYILKNQLLGSWMGYTQRRINSFLSAELAVKTFSFKNTSQLLFKPVKLIIGFLRNLKKNDYSKRLPIAYKFQENVNKALLPKNKVL